MRYVVTWTIDAEGDTPLPAAEEAFAAMNDPDTPATFFTVRDDQGREYEVDLNFEDARARVRNVRTGEVQFFSL
jgi:hypothetical protein